MTGRSIASTWGSTPEERAMAFPCDHYFSHVDSSYFRAVDVQAPAHIVFQWLCQLRVAPYSYDWIDNTGRQSPRQRNPELENLEVGQSVMSIFKLVEFEPDRHLTILLTAARGKRIFGEIASSYVILPGIGQECRLVAKLVVRYPQTAPWSFMRWFLPWGDLVMMRKQLLTLKHLAEISLDKTSLETLSL